MATTSYYHYDALGSTRMLTDEDEAVTDSYTYDGYGNEISATGSTVNPFRYVGELGYYFDSDTGDYYVRARHYDPVSARWLSEDPFVDSEYLGGTNLYAYVGEMPLIFTDSSGLHPKPSPPKDDRGVSARYCDAMRAHPEIKWLGCACRVSRLIDAAIAGLLGTAISIGSDDPDYAQVVARAKWLRCMRTCIVKKWQAGFYEWEGIFAPQDPVTDAWQEYIDACPCGKSDSKDCCSLQVKAEQKSFTDCTKKCGKWKWGNSFPVGQLPNWDPNDDFNSEIERINYGIELCCEGDALSQKGK